MAKKKNTTIDPDELAEKAKEDPRSKKWNNPNSRKNLKQYQNQKPDVLEGELILSNSDDPALDDQVGEITRGRKISPELVKKLIPKRGIMTPVEKDRYTGVVTTFLSDFKNEEPTATDIDDILEIALCDIMYMRLLDMSKDDATMLIAASQSMERFHKRKAEAKKNLANRRVDRKDARNNQDVNIVDLVVRYDTAQKLSEEERIAELLEEKERMGSEMKKLIDEEEF